MGAKTQGKSKEGGDRLKARPTQSEFKERARPASEGGPYKGRKIESAW